MTIFPPGLSEVRRKSELWAMSHRAATVILMVTTRNYLVPLGASWKETPGDLSTSTVLRYSEPDAGSAYYRRRHEARTNAKRPLR